MTYYVNPVWFYLIDVMSGWKTFLTVFGCVGAAFSIFALIAILADGYDLDDNLEKVMKIVKRAVVTTLIMIVIGLLLPSQETSTKMLIASQVTKENVSATKEEIYELVDYITDKINGGAEERTDDGQGNSN